MNLKSERTLRILSIIVFIIYFGIMVWIISLKCNDQFIMMNSYEFLKDRELFERISIYIYGLHPEAVNPYQGNAKGFMLDEFLNILIFLPLGIYLGFFLKKENIFKVLGISFLVSFCFEFIQWISLIGCFGINDLITNTLGALIGYIIFKLLYKKNNSPNKIKIFNIISIVLIVIFLPIFVYAIIGTIKTIPFYIDIILRRL